MRAATPSPGTEGHSPARPAGGYRLIPVVQLAMAWWSYRSGLIRLVDLRVHLACHEMAARRCLSARVGLPASFRPEEAARLDIAPGRPLLAVTSVNVDRAGARIQTTRSLFAADRVELVME